MIMDLRLSANSENKQGTKNYIPTVYAGMRFLDAPSLFDD